MRQRRWLELVKDYDCEIFYRPEKANSVTDALSCKDQARLMAVRTLQPELQNEMEWFGLEIMANGLANLVIQPTIFDEMKGAAT